MVVSLLYVKLCVHGGSKPAQPTPFASTVDLGRVCPKLPHKPDAHPGPPQAPDINSDATDAPAGQQDYF